MKIAVFGSWSDEDADRRWGFSGSRDKFDTACKEVGRGLAQDGHKIIVESEDQSVADPHVVEGYIEVASSTSSRDLQVELFYPRGKPPFESHSRSHPNLFTYHAQPVREAQHQQWSNSHLVSIKHSDSVLTIGDKQGTYLAGSAAIVANKPLVPIASFGGASARLVEELKGELGDPLPSAYNKLNNPWGDGRPEQGLGHFARRHAEAWNLH